MNSPVSSAIAGEPVATARTCAFSSALPSSVVSVLLYVGYVARARQQLDVVGGKNLSYLFGLVRIRRSENVLLSRHASRRRRRE